MPRVCFDSASAHRTALSIDYPREGMIKNSTHGISVLWSVGATDNFTAPIVLYLNQTAYNGDMTSEESGPIEMGRGEYTFASPAVTLSTYHLLIVAENQSLAVGNFKVSVNRTLNEQTSSSSHELTSSDSSATLQGSSQVDAGSTTPDALLSSMESAPKVKLQTRSTESAKESAMLTTKPEAQDDDGDNTKLAIGVGIGMFMLLAIIAAGIVWFFSDEKSLGSVNPPPHGMELGNLSRVSRADRTNVAQLHAQTLSEVH